MGGCQVHISRGLCWRKKKKRIVASQMERRATLSGERSVLYWSSCEVLFSIRCIILRTHLTFQAELVWNSHIKKKKSPRRARWLTITRTCCVELKRFACLCRRNVWAILKQGHFLLPATDTFNWGCQQWCNLLPTCLPSHQSNSSSSWGTWEAFFPQQDLSQRHFKQFKVRFC